MLLRVLLAALLVSSVPTASDVFAQDGEGKESLPEAAKRWSWSETHDSLDTSAKKLFADFDMGVVQREVFCPLDQQPIKIEGVAPSTTVTQSFLVIKKGAKIVIDAETSGEPALARSKNVIFVAEPRPGDCGCSVTAYDLETGRRLWATVEAVGQTAHSMYSNRVQVEVIGQVLVVRGWETLGKYIECLSTATGRAVWHEKLSSTSVPEAAKRWSWSEKQDSLGACVKGLLPELDVAVIETETRPWRHAVIRSKRGERIVLEVPAWELGQVGESGFTRTALARSKNDLYVSEHGPVEGRCAVVAYDLETGKKLWRTELWGIGLIKHSHSPYTNRVQMEMVDQVLVVRGWETAGKYVECLATASGDAVWREKLADDGRVSVPEAAKQWSWLDAEKLGFLDVCAKNLLPDLDVAVIDTDTGPWDKAPPRIGARSASLRVKKGERILLEVPVWELRLPVYQPRKAGQPVKVDHFTPGARTALARSKNVLFVAEQSPVSDGCAVAAYDLETGKRLWRTELEALGPVSHKQGFNHVQMEVIDQVLVVRGWEEAGKYVECLATATGRSVWPENVYDSPR